MFRWETVEEKKVFGEERKMYREPFRALKTIAAPMTNMELDYFSYKYYGSEIYMYRILDTNFVEYMEERGDISRLSSVLIPVIPDEINTVL